MRTWSRQKTDYKRPI